MRPVVVRTTDEKLKAEIEVGSEHRLLADEPEAKGGGDRGPTPFELLASSLGACKALTVKMYAAHKQWPVQGIEVQVTQAKTDDAYVFSAELSIAGPVNEEQRQRLLEISERCPVQRTLSGTIRITTRLTP